MAPAVIKLIVVLTLWGLAIWGFSHLNDYRVKRKKRDGNTNGQ